MITEFQLIDDKIVPGGEGDCQVTVVTAPHFEYRRTLIDEHGLDEHTLNSALDPDELSRMEFEPDHLAVIYKRPMNVKQEDEMVFGITSTGLFLFKDRLFVVSGDKVQPFDGKTFARVSTLPEMMLKLIYRSISHFLVHLKGVNQMSEALEDKINASMENSVLIDLFTLEKTLVYYLNAISSNRMLLEKLRQNHRKIGFTAEELEFLDDMMIENAQCYQQAEIYSNILASLMDARASIVGNNLNILMKTLNIITIGIMVPTFVVSAFSMNVKIPLATYPNAFWFVMGMALVSVISMMVLWRYRKW